MKTSLLARATLGLGLVTVALAGCASSQAGPRVLSNQTAGQGGGSPPRVSPGAQGPVILWCTTPTGMQCARATRELGVAHTPTEELPPDLDEKDWRDLDDDCVDPDIQSWLKLLSVALAVPDDGWVDQGGAVSVDQLAYVAHGGGCTNRTAPGVPDVKVQLAETPGGLLAFVRVWELEDMP